MIADIVGFVYCTYEYREEVCDECGNTIPFDENTVRDGDGSIANKHHDESYSLYDPDQE